MPKLLLEQLNALHLHGMRQALEEMPASDISTLSSEILLSRLLEAESCHRHTRSFMYRLTLAKLPQIKTFEQFDLSGLPITQTQLDPLIQGRFIDAHENIFIIGGFGYR